MMYALQILGHSSRRFGPLKLDYPTAGRVPVAAPSTFPKVADHWRSRRAWRRRQCDIFQICSRALSLGHRCRLIPWHSLHRKVEQAQMPNRADFQAELDKRFQVVESSGASSIEVRAGDQHRAVGHYPDPFGISC